MHLVCQNILLFFSCLRIAAVTSIDSVNTVGDAASSFGMYARCGAWLMHALPLIFPVRFSFRNSSNDSVFIVSSLLSFVASITVHVSITCSCVSLSMAACCPFAPNFLRPGFKLFGSSGIPRLSSLPLSSLAGWSPLQVLCHQFLASSVKQNNLGN